MLIAAFIVGAAAWWACRLARPARADRRRSSSRPAELDTDTFKALSADALQQNNDSFLAARAHASSSRSGRSLKRFDEKVEALERARQRDRRRTLTEHLLALAGRARRGCAARPRASSRRSARPTCAASGASCSSSARSSSPACSSTATSTSRRHDRRTTAVCCGPTSWSGCRAGRTSSSTRRCRPRRVPRFARSRRRGRRGDPRRRAWHVPDTSATTCARLGDKALLAAVHAGARVRDHVPARRELLPRRARARRDAARARPGAARDPLRRPTTLIGAAQGRRRRPGSRRRSPRTRAR